MAKLLQDVLNRLEKVEHDIETIELGVYGDSKNEVKGLIQSVRELQTTVKMLQDQRKKVIYFSGGAIVVLEVVWGIIKWLKII